MKNDTGLFVI